MSTSTEHARLLRLATRASVAVASLLIITKAIAWRLRGSISMLAGLTDSLLDGVTSFLNLLAVKKNGCATIRIRTLKLQEC